MLKITATKIGEMDGGGRREMAGRGGGGETDLRLVLLAKDSHSSIILFFSA